MAENTIRAGLRELESGETLEAGRVRRAGGGRRPLTESDPTLLGDLERLVDPGSRGDPELPLRCAVDGEERAQAARRAGRAGSSGQP